jgi:hypothetical protein
MVEIEVVVFWVTTPYSRAGRYDDWDDSDASIFRIEVEFLHLVMEAVGTWEMFVTYETERCHNAED